MAATQPHWSLFSNHARVLFLLARSPHARLADLASQLELTERTVLRLIGELVDAGLLRKIREGRRNRYEIREQQRIPNAPLESRGRVGELITVVLPLNGSETDGA